MDLWPDSAVATVWLAIAIILAVVFGLGVALGAWAF